MKEQKLVYLTRRQTEVGQLKVSLEQNNFELSQIIGHRLKGHGETFGFPQISSFGILMEEAALGQDKEKLREIVNSLEEVVQKNLKIFHSMT